MADVIYAGDAGVFKTCTKCGETKRLFEFHKDRRGSLGRSSRCAECAIAATKTYTAKNHEEVKRKKRETRVQNPERTRELEARSREKFAEKRRKRERERYWSQRDIVLEKRRSPEGRAYARERMRAKMECPAERLHSNISRAIRASVKDKKRREWEALVGYSLDDLRSHLERQFARGMTWSNHGQGDGKWHIDHILPKSSFNFESSEDPEFRACWAITNLRPMWGRDNISKHAKRIYLI